MVDDRLGGVELQRLLEIDHGLGVAFEVVVGGGSIGERFRILRRRPSSARVAASMASSYLPFSMSSAANDIP